MTVFKIIKQHTELPKYGAMLTSNIESHRSNDRKGFKTNGQELLSHLKDNYEKEKFPIDFPDPVEAIKFRMEQLGYKQKDLAKVMGLKSRVSEILNHKRKLTLEMIRKLHKVLGIPTEVLVREY